MENNRGRFAAGGAETSKAPFPRVESLGRVSAPRARRHRDSQRCRDVPGSTVKGEARRHIQKAGGHLGSALSALRVPDD